MGTKKLKKKKLKCKKLLKLQNVKKSSISKSNNTINNSKIQYFSSNSPEDNRLLDCKKNSRFLSEKYISKVKYFAQIREQYFGYLQAVVFDHCKYYETVVPEDFLETLTLELEQNALLACLQSDIYEKLMNKIISDIERCTEENQIHPEVKKLLPNSFQKEVLSNIKTEKSLSIPPEAETYTLIPVISSSRSDNNSNFTSTVAEPESFNYETLNTDSEYIESYQKFNNANQIEVVELEESYSAPVDQSVYWNNKTEYNGNYCENSVVVNQSCSIVNNNNVIKVTPVESETLLESRNQLQKSVEQNLKEVEKVKKQKKDEKERAYIAQILEGDDSVDNKFYDSLSDNENESKENVDETNLLDRLEKMRELFGLEEEDNSVPVVTEKPKIKPQKLKPRRPTMWKYEKIIQLHKLSLLSSESTFERRLNNRILFLELFGEDSDEENEVEYLSEEKFRASCTERISSWVVKYLMPYYHDKRIVGRNVFKSLGHCISDTIVDKIQYPDEWTVKYFVSKFFPPRKKYLSEADVFAFEIEEM